MKRAPYQVLVLPFKGRTGKDPLYAIFRRADSSVWQGVAGGGESTESPLEAAKREAFEEAGIPPNSTYLALDSVATIPVVNICGFKWGPNVLVIPEHCFGVLMDGAEVRLSEFRWEPYAIAYRLLEWNSNKNALWELDTRIRKRQLNARRRARMNRSVRNTKTSQQQGG